MKKEMGKNMMKKGMDKMKKVDKKEDIKMMKGMKKKGKK
jgi:hypothetical protein